MQIAILLFERFTVLDAIGPYQVLSGLPGAEVSFVAEHPGPVRDEEGSLVVSAQAGLADVPRPDIVVVPGGPGDQTAQAIQLMIEYDPRPPYDAGSPDSAPAELVSGMRARSRFLLTARRG